MGKEEGFQEQKFESDIEKIDKEIEQLKQQMWEIYNNLNPELQEKYDEQEYCISMEADVGKNRMQAKARLEEFIKVLESEAKKLK